MRPSNNVCIKGKVKLQCTHAHAKDFLLRHILEVGAALILGLIAILVIFAPVISADSNEVILTVQVFDAATGEPTDGAYVRVESARGRRAALGHNQSTTVGASERVFLEVESQPGWAFDHWDAGPWARRPSHGGLSVPLKIFDPTATTVEVQFDHDTFIAVFIKRAYRLTTSARGRGNVAPSSGTYDAGARLQLAATPDNGSSFVHWRIDAGAGMSFTSTDNPHAFTLARDTAAEALFIESIPGGGGGDGGGEEDGGGEQQGGGGSGLLDSGAGTDEVWVDFSFLGTETGTPEEPYNTLAEGTAAVLDNGTVFVMAGATDETLAIDKVLRIESVGGSARIGVAGATNLPLLLTVAVEGNGLVIKTPDLEGYDPNDVVLLTAEAAEGWNFRMWQGDANGAGSPYPILMDRHRSVTAIFEAGAYESPVIISEVYAEGTGFSQGWPGDLDDAPWIELYNRSGSAVNVGGWALTTNVTVPDMWLLPSVSIPSGSFFVVAATGTGQSPPETTHYHTNFTLDRDGNYLALYTNDQPRRLASEFSPAFPEIARGWSYAYNETEGRYEFTNEPTPEGANSESTAFGILMIEPMAVDFGDVDVQ